MKKKIRYSVIILIPFLVGIKVGDIVNAIKYKSEIQEFRNTKTAECFVTQKKEELTVN
jgi:hypothetical protein